MDATAKRRRPYDSREAAHRAPSDTVRTPAGGEMRRISLVALLTFGFAASLAAQSLQIGAAGAGVSPDLDLGSVRTDISLNYPATATGLIQTATFYWSVAPC